MSRRIALSGVSLALGGAPPPHLQSLSDERESPAGGSTMSSAGHGLSDTRHVIDTRHDRVAP